MRREILWVDVAAFHDRLTSCEGELRVIRQHRPRRNLKRHGTASALRRPTPCITQGRHQAGSQRASSCLARQMAPLTSVLSASVSIRLPFGETQSGHRFFEADYTGPPLIDIYTLGDLGELLGKSCHNAASVDATPFQGNYLALSFCAIFKEPVRMFLALHPADHAPCSVSMRHG